MYVQVGSSPQVPSTEIDPRCEDSTFVANQLAKAGYVSRNEEEINDNLIDFAIKQGIIKDPASAGEVEMAAICQALLAIESPPETPPPAEDDKYAQYKKWGVIGAFGFLGIAIIASAIKD